MSEVATSGEPIQQDIEVLRKLAGPNCQPSPESISDLQSADLVLISGQFVGAGKSTFIKALQDEGRVNIASWTNRDLRPGEVEGVDKCHRTLSVMAAKAKEGYFLELEEIRPGFFYATPAEFTPGKNYVKDLELKGALRLRTFAPNLPIVVPLPPLSSVPEKQVTEWERRVVLREGFNSGIDDRAIGDLKGRLEGVVEEVDRILDHNLTDDPNTLFIVNDDLQEALDEMHTFLKAGERSNKGDIKEHLQRMRVIAAEALHAA